MDHKIFIYQVLPRLFGNIKTLNKENGSIEENGTGKLSAFSDKALKEIKKMGYTHIWYTGILEHASKTDYSSYGIDKGNPDVIKGNAGSPYAIKDYYDVCPDLADDIENRILEFEALVKRSHKNGLKVIIDFVPNHVAREYYSDKKPRKVVDFGANDNANIAFLPDNNFYYIPGKRLELELPNTEVSYEEYPARATGNDQFSNRPNVNDWYETVKLNYGVDYCNNKTKYFTPVPDTWLKMKDILLYWAAREVDGFRCDMAEMVPVEFWSWVISEVKTKYKALLFIAEVYNPAEYHNYINFGLFDYLYDKVDLYDTVRNVICGKQPSSDITFTWQRNDGLLSHMLYFLENHDEQRIASDYFAGDPIKAIPGMITLAAMNTNPVMVYAGQELGERGMDKEGFSGVDGRTTIFDYWSVKSLHNWYNSGNFGTENLSKDEIYLQKTYSNLINLCNNEETLQKGQFYDLMYANYDNPNFDSTKQYVFLRSYNKSFSLVVTNFASEDVSVFVDIPPEAFLFMNIDPTQIIKQSDLFSHRIKEFSFTSKVSLKIKLNKYSGKILKFYSN